jgi:thioredoxin 1
MRFSRAGAFALVVSVLVSTPLRAAEVRRYDAATFAAAQRAGRPILIDVKAWWCPVCASQNSTIKRVIASPAYNNLLVLEINYDKQKADWRRFGVQKQATLIAFRSGHEIQRLQFVTDHDQITALLGRLAG